MEDEERKALEAVTQTHVANRKPGHSSIPTSVAPGAEVDAGLADLGGYNVIQEDATHFTLRHREHENEPREEFKLEMVEEGGKIVFKGMPEIMTKFLMGFEQSEIK